MVLSTAYHCNPQELLYGGLLRLWLYFVVVPMFVGLPVAVKGQAPELPIKLPAEQILQFAHRLFSQQEYFRALGEYQRFLSLYPDDPKASTAALGIVQCYSHGKHWQEALEAADAFLGDYAQSELILKVRFLRARALTELNRGEEAREAYREIIRATPGQLFEDAAWYRIGLTFAREHRWLEADDALRLVGRHSTLHGEAESVRRILAEASQTTHKDPTMAGVLALLPGAGHLYCGRPRDAALAFLFTGAFAWATVEAFDQNHEELGIALGLVTLAFYAGSIFSAVNVAHKYNDREDRRLREQLAPYERVSFAGRQPPSVSVALKFFF